MFPSHKDECAPETGAVNAIEMYKAEMKHRKSARYVSQVVAIIGRLSVHAGVPVEKINSNHIRSWLTDMGENVKARTLNNQIAACRGFFAWGVRAELWLKSPVDGIQPYKAVRRTARAFTVSEVIRIIEAAESDERAAQPECQHRDGSTVRRADLYRFLSITGFRAGEAEVLRWRDFRLQETPPNVVLQGGLTRKNHDGRTVTLAVEDAAWLASIMGDPDDLAFERPRWEVIERDRIAAGIEEHDKYGRTVGLHSFRRYVATALAQAKVSPALTAKMLGHRDIKTTLDIYTDTENMQDSELSTVLHRPHDTGQPQVEKNVPRLKTEGPRGYRTGRDESSRLQPTGLDGRQEIADTSFGMVATLNNTRQDARADGAARTCRLQGATAPRPVSMSSVFGRGDSRDRFEPCIAHSDLTDECMTNPGSGDLGFFCAPDSSLSSIDGMVPGEMPGRRVLLRAHETPSSASSASAGGAGYIRQCGDTPFNRQGGQVTPFIHTPIGLADDLSPSPLKPASHVSAGGSHAPDSPTSESRGNNPSVPGVHGRAPDFDFYSAGGVLSQPLAHGAPNPARARVVSNACAGFSSKQLAALLRADESVRLAVAALLDGV